MTDHAKVEPVVTRGNVWSMIATLLTGLVLFSSLVATSTSTNKDLQQTQSEVTAIKSGLEAARASIRQLEISEARTSERYNSILSNVDEMKTQLREQNELLRDIIGKEKSK